MALLDSKETLAKLLGSEYVVPTAFATGSCPTLHASSTTNTWYSRNQFANSTISYTTTDPNEEFFVTDTNGWKVKKKGLYRLTTNNYIYTNGASTGVKCRIFNYTKKSSLGESWQGTAKAWYFGVSLDIVAELDAGDIVIPQFSRIEGTALFRPARHNLIVQLLKLLEDE